MTDHVTGFYDSLSPFYHLIYPDWEKSMERQAEMLHELIRERWPGATAGVLDVACGIGTQSLGLAKLGYEVTASDLSPDEVRRASLEAAKRGLLIPCTVADIRTAYDHHQRRFDIVIACDNAIPHLLNDEDILDAFRQMYACTRPEGGCIISVRDYDAEDWASPGERFYGSREEHGTSYLLLQKRDWRGSFYDLTMYVVEDDGAENVKTHVMRSVYYSVTISRLITLMESAGFTDVDRHDDVFFQPVITGTRGQW